MGKKLMASLPMEGKLYADGLQSMDADDHLLTAMVCDLGLEELAWSTQRAGRGHGVSIVGSRRNANSGTDPADIATWIRSAGPAVQLSLF
jgi:hypothetical protein